MIDENPAHEDGQPDLFPLSVLLEQSGVNRRTLLSWERRYGILPTARDTSGRRLYSTDLCRRIAALHHASGAGFRIGDLIDKTVEELGRLVPTARRDPLLDDLLAAAGDLDSERVDLLLGRMIQEEGLAPFLLDRGMRILTTIGERWASQLLPPASEHLVSMHLNRQLVSALVAIRVAPGAPAAVCATLSGEEHEFGALASAIVARLAGIDAIYLGGNLPPLDIAAAALRRQARLVAISLVNGDVTEARRLITALRAALPDDIALLVGGRLSSDCAVAGVARSHDLGEVARACALLQQALDRDQGTG